MTPELVAILSIVVTAVISALGWLTKTLIGNATARADTLQKIVDEGHAERLRVAAEQVTENRALRAELTGLKIEAVGLRAEVATLTAIAAATERTKARAE